MKKKIDNGFSAVETLVVISIIVLISLTLAVFQKDIFSLSDIISNSFIGQGEGRVAFKTMSSEIRSLSPSSLGAYPIASATNSSFTFYSDIDEDGLKERVRYFIDGTVFKKGVLKPSGNPLTYNPANEQVIEIIHYVDNGATPIFNYYDTDYDGFTPALEEPINILEVRLVKVTIIIDRNSSEPPGPVTMTTQVSMRNLKDNL